MSAAEDAVGDDQVPDLNRAPRVHVVAVGGAAMSAVAFILRARGHAVTGSDQVDSPVLGRLRSEGITVWVGHDAGHVEGADLVAVSTAVPADNVEVRAATGAAIPVAGRPAMMAAISRGRRVVAVSGTHGKTTTTAMTVLAFRAGSLDPSFIVGGTVRQLGTGVAWTGGPWLVVEADESDGSFLRFDAEAVVVTNLEADHLDFHGSMDALEAAFDRFLAGASGPKVVCIDDPGAARLAERAVAAGAAGVLTYGSSPAARYRIAGIVPDDRGNRVRVELDGRTLAELTLAVPGAHNARNATAALAVAHTCGVSADVAAAALSAFTGVGRRFERRGGARGVLFVDDYAHLPTEVAATVTAARQQARTAGWTRIVAVFQPHRYTRIAALAADFAGSFAGADVVVITGIYAAGQQPIAGVTGALVAEAVHASHPELDVRYIETREELVAALTGGLLVPGDLCLTMNAGDLTTLPDELLAHPWAEMAGASE